MNHLADDRNRGACYEWLSTQRWEQFGNIIRYKLISFGFNLSFSMGS